MTNHAKTALMGGVHVPFAAHTMIRGPRVFLAPPDDPPGGGADDPDDDNEGDPQTVPLTVHQAIVTAHEALKKDHRKRGARITELEGQVATLTTERDEARQQAEAGDGAAALAQANANHQQQVATLNQQHAAEIARRDNRINRMARDAALDEALIGLNVNPRLFAAAKALHSGKIDVEWDDQDEDAPPIVTMGDVPLKDALKVWAETEDGKAFVVDGNSGGGAGGGSKPKVGKNPWRRNEWNMTEQARLEKSDPARAARLKAEAKAAA